MSNKKYEWIDGKYNSYFLHINNLITLSVHWDCTSHTSGGHVASINGEYLKRMNQETKKRETIHYDAVREAKKAIVNYYKKIVKELAEDIDRIPYE
jgi:hypothetical protein